MDPKHENCIESTKVGIKEDKCLKSSSRNHEDLGIVKEEDELQTTKAKIEEAKKENERLKMVLESIEKDYRSLQKRFFTILQQQDQAPGKLVEAPAVCTNYKAEKELEVSLCLGRTPISLNKDVRNPSKSSKVKEDMKDHDLTLGLEFKHSFKTDLSEIEMGSKKSRAMEGQREERENDTKETGSRSKVSNRMRSTSVEKEELVQSNNNAKRARVSVRARCDGPTMNDGCQWRKYGQKTSKGNPCPRAYYRCTISPSCPVRKQVQRCIKDLSILITTYEGTHNHPLPSAATAMASTTSAAASLLISGSSSSTSATTSATASATALNLNGLNFTLDHSLKTTPFNFPASSFSPPTITLDLTTTPPSYLNGLSSSFLLNSPKYPSATSLDFSSSHPYPYPYPFPKIPSSYNSYDGFLNFEKSQKTNQLASSPSSSSSFLTDTLTKVITSDPSFQFAVAAALSSMVNGGKDRDDPICVNKLTPMSTPDLHHRANESFNLSQPSISFPLSKSSSTPSTDI